MAHEYVVELEEQEEGPDAALRERFAACAAVRLEIMEDGDASHYPAVGETIEILDNFEGPFVWEMSDEELETNPPTMVWLDVTSVDPAEAPATPSTVRVTMTVPF